MFNSKENHPNYQLERDIGKFILDDMKLDNLEIRLKEILKDKPNSKAKLLDLV